MTMVLLARAAILIVLLFGALYWWTRRSEHEMNLERPGLSEEDRSSVRRFGRRVGVNAGNTGRM